MPRLVHVLFLMKHEFGKLLVIPQLQCSLSNKKLVTIDATSQTYHQRLKNRVQRAGINRRDNLFQLVQYNDLTLRAILRPVAQHSLDDLLLTSTRHCYRNHQIVVTGDKEQKAIRKSTTELRKMIQLVERKDTMLQKLNVFTPDGKHESAHNRVVDRQNLLHAHHAVIESNDVAEHLAKHVAN